MKLLLLCFEILNKYFLYVFSVCDSIDIIRILMPIFAYGNFIIQRTWDRKYLLKSQLATGTRNS